RESAPYRNRFLSLAASIHRFGNKGKSQSFSPASQAVGGHLGIFLFCIFPGRRKPVAAFFGVEILKPSIELSPTA
ncbi:MAG: hypothetical protein WCD57_06655, partial [Acidobacteriaceae bacterium]